MKRFAGHIFVLLAILLSRCGGSVIPPNPINDFKDQYRNEYQYTIILNDMDLKEDQYQHKYKIMHLNKRGEVSFENTDWMDVDDFTFELYEPNLGMEILSKDETGRYNNLATPPGFTFIINNDRYGYWEGASDESLESKQITWKFHPAYSDLNQQLELDQLTVTYEEYVNFQNKYKYNRPFYGEKYHKDSTKYGTYSRHWIIMRPMFYQRRLNKRYFNKNTSGSGGGNRGGGGFGK